MASTPSQRQRADLGGRRRVAPQLRCPVGDAAHHAEHGAVDDVDQDRFFEHGALEGEVVDGVEDGAEHADEHHPVTEQGEAEAGVDVRADALLRLGEHQPHQDDDQHAEQRQQVEVGEGHEILRPWCRGRRGSRSLPDHGRRCTFCWVTAARAATLIRPSPAIITPRAGVRLRNVTGSSSAKMPMAGMAKM